VRAQAEFDLSRYEIEEFIEGPILHIDGLVQSSKVLIQIPSRYIGTCLGYAQGQPLGSVQIEPSKEVEEWTQACIRAVGIENGCFHLEAIQSPKGLVFLEIGARVGGADVVDSFELKTNMHLPSSELKILLEPERPVLLRLQISSNYFGWFVYPGHHLAAEYAQVRGTESFKAHASVFRWDELTPTQKLPRKITYQAVEVPVAGVVQGPSSSYLECFVQHIFEEVLLEPLEMPRQTQSASGV
jgi:hypothetical protein